MSDQRVSETFAAVADPTRVQLLRFLLEEEHCVTQCTQEVQLAQSAVSRHLARLVRAGLITRRPAGRRAYHRVSNPDAVRALLDHANSL